MAVEFNFRGLHPAFVEAVNRHEPSIAFSLTDGRGKFTFLLFLRTDSKGKIAWGKLELFIVLGTTQQVRRFQLYGNHRQGDFTIWLKPDDEAAIRAELGLNDAESGPAFVLPNFLAKLNAMIPASIPLEAKIDTMKQERLAIDAYCKDYVEDATKVHLLGVKALPAGHMPREETLRKLYMLNARTADIAALIGNLKAIRWTVCWTATRPTDDKFAEAFAKAAAARVGQ
jgi:hypothetical protein